MDFSEKSLLKNRAIFIMASLKLMANYDFSLLMKLIFSHTASFFVHIFFLFVRKIKDGHAYQLPSMAFMAFCWWFRHHQSVLNYVFCTLELIFIITIILFCPTIHKIIFFLHWAMFFHSKKHSSLNTSAILNEYQSNEWMNRFLLLYSYM